MQPCKKNLDIITTTCIYLYKNQANWLIEKNAQWVLEKFYFISYKRMSTIQRHFAIFTSHRDETKFYIDGPPPLPTNIARTDSKQYPYALAQ